MTGSDDFLAANQTPELNQSALNRSHKRQNQALHTSCDASTPFAALFAYAPFSASQQPAADAGLWLDGNTEHQFRK